MIEWLSGRGLRVTRWSVVGSWWRVIVSRETEEGEVSGVGSQNSAAAQGIASSRWRASRNDEGAGCGLRGAGCEVRGAGCELRAASCGEGEIRN